MEFRRLWRLIRRVDTREILYLAGLGLGIEPFWIPANTFPDRRIDEYLDEFAGRKQGSYHLALGAIGGNERADDDEPGLCHQFRQLARAANILHPIGLGKPEIAAQAVADVVAVEQHG